MSKRTLKVRAGGLTPQGYQAIATAVGWERRSEAQARDLIINARHNVSAWHTDEPEGEKTLVGMGRATGVGAKYAHIADIAVLPDFQGTGVGTAIVNHLLALVDRETSIDATVTLHTAPYTTDFYVRFGFLSSATPGLMTRNRSE
jgi:GNAT superfamily N-acetyltransferase